MSDSKKNLVWGRGCFEIRRFPGLAWWKVDWTTNRDGSDDPTPTLWRAFQFGAYRFMVWSRFGMIAKRVWMEEGIANG